MATGNTPVNWRQVRVERLLEELREEITLGMMAGELDEFLGFAFIVPVSKSLKNGVVRCEFRTRPQLAVTTNPDEMQPRLQVVK